MKKIIISILFCMATLTSYPQIVNNKVNGKFLELNTGWVFHQLGNPDWHPATVPGTVHTDLFNNGLIQDPYYRTNEKDQQWIDKVNWEYATKFTIDQSTIASQNISILFKGLDTYAEVYLNDHHILSTDNMFREWEVECKKWLKSGDNTLRIYFKSPIIEGIKKMEENGYLLPAVNDQSDVGGLGNNTVSVFSRKAGYHFGWDWGPRLVTSGIWRPVYLKVWNTLQIQDLFVIQKKITNQLAELVSKIEVEAEISGDYELFIKEGDHTLTKKNISLVKGKNTLDVDFSIKNPKLWWCNGLGEPNLYKLKAQLLKANTILDEKSCSIGIRTIEVVQEPDKDGKGKSFYFKLNGRPVFAKGANYIPNDVLLPRVTDERYESVVKSAFDANMNMLRVWGGGVYENDIFYDLCDKYGIMIWHDFMFACAMYPGGKEFFENIKQEAVQNVRRLRNHPCIVLWCGNNENETAWGEGDENHGWKWKEKYTKEQRKEIYGNYDTVFHQILPEVISQNTDRAFYWPSSPTGGPGVLAGYDHRSGDMHYWGVWHGKHPFSDFNKYIGRFMSEYGFQSFPEFKTVKTYTIPEDWDISSNVMMAHQRSGKGNFTIKEYMKDMYREPKDFESFLYVSQLLQAEGVKSAIEAHRRAMPYCMGTLYWQLNDCWQVASWSSVDYFLRWKALHYFARESYKETIVIPFLEDDTVKIYATTDRINELDATLKMNLITFDGTQLWEKSKPVKLKSNQGILLFEIPVEGLLNKRPSNNILLYTEIVVNDKILSDNILYLVAAKDLDLKHPEIKSSISKTGVGYSISLTSDILAKNVYLVMDGKEGFFTDNYFDLLPGKLKTIEFNCEEAINDIDKLLKIITLADTF